MGVGSVASATVVLIVSIIVAVSVMPKRQAIPPHLLHHPFIENKEFFDESMVDALLQMTRDGGFIPSASREYDSYKVVHDNIGEAVPFNKSLGKCPKTYLMPNGDMTKCVFPGRTDVGRHFIRTGGPEGVKESYETLVSRVQPFQKIILNWTEHPTSRRLLTDEKFLALAKGVCPKDKQILDQFQFNFVVTLPGQTVATHLDAPYFQRASRFHVPQWLLATMVFSGLFQDDFINQVQVVGYYHKWKEMKGKGGNFVFWADENVKPSVAVPVSGSGNSVDGSKVVHAAGIYMSERLPPKLSQQKVNILRYRNGTNLWDVVSDNEVVGTYSEDEIRFAAVYRARCFESQAAIDKYREDQKNPWTLDYIFGVFRQDLFKRKLLSSVDEPMDAYDFGLLLMDTYVKYPLSADAIIPYNWCALDRMFPLLTPVVKAFCN